MRLHKYAICDPTVETIPNVSFTVTGKDIILTCKLIRKMPVVMQGALESQFKL